MKQYFLFFGLALALALAACAASQQSENSGPAGKAVNAPACIQKLIRKFKSEEVTNPPRSIYSYIYNGSKVYYVPAQCCDYYSDLYNKRCLIIAHPDGGFTGKGDGKAKDFLEKRTNEKLVWKDQRVSK